VYLVSASVRYSLSSDADGFNAGHELKILKSGTGITGASTFQVVSINSFTNGTIAPLLQLTTVMLVNTTDTLTVTFINGGNQINIKNTPESTYFSVIKLY
jgi:hypothetical protein